MGIHVSIDEAAPGTVNMQRDLALLDAADADGEAHLRLYRFAPACLTLGRLQADDDVDWKRCRTEGVEVVRRPTGGRAILHDDEVTYAIACPSSDPRFGGDVLGSCARIHAVIGHVLRDLGVPCTPRSADPDERAAGLARARVGDCFARPASHELLDGSGAKLVGSAQHRRGQSLLQHGSILLAPPRAADYLIAGEVEAKRTAGVRALLGRAVTWHDLAQAMASGFAAAAATPMVR